MNDWTSDALLNVLSIVIDFRGRTPKKLGMEWGGGDIPALSANNVEMGQINFAKECYYGSDALYKKWMTKGDAQLGDIVLTTEAPLGNVAQVPDHQRYILSQRAILLRADDATLSNDYLAHYLRSERFQSLMRQQSSGTTATGIQRKKLETLPIRFPCSRLEQLKIAEGISFVDQAVQQTETLIGKYQRIKMGMMQDLLTRGIDEHGNLRSESTHKFKDSPLGRIPAEWDAAQITSVVKGGARNGYFKKPESVGSGYKLINVSEIYQPFGINTECQEVERVTASVKDLNSYGANEGDLFFTRSSLVLEGIAHCNILLRLNEPTLFECHVMRMRPDREKIVPEFLALACQSHHARLFLMSRAKHVTMTTISQPELEMLIVPMPSSMEEQSAIVTALLSSDDTIRRYKKQRWKLQQIKTALMQDLLTGKKRVTPLLELALTH